MEMWAHRRRSALLAGLVVAAIVAGACSSKSRSSAASSPTVKDDGARTRVTSADGRLTLETTSSRAADVTGGDVLVTVSGPAAASLKLARNGEDVTTVLVQAGLDRRGLVQGLRLGPNTLEASAGTERLSLTLVDHPSTGPVFAGPHLSPWTCTTASLGLGAPSDADCSAPTRTTWSYRTTTGTLKALANPAQPPADVAQATLAGNRVPFIVRGEEGVIDRGVYWIWVLDPHPLSGGIWDPSGWNQRLIYQFGGGCGEQYSQGSTLLPGNGLDPELLARGYAVATNTLDTFESDCNPTLSAEAAMMTREHFIKSYGVPRFTIGDGGSGGAIQQIMTAQNYPGLLDGIAPSLPFPDAITIAQGVTDCGLLLRYYTTPAGAALSDAQKQAIEDHQSSGTCVLWSQLFLSAIDPSAACPSTIPHSQIFDVSRNPTGLRCSLQDINSSVFGRDPATGYAKRPLDNVGVQYGLRALNSGVITPDQFLDLNAGVGGYDINGKIVPQREAVDEATAAIPYRTGQATFGGALLDVPIILTNIDTDPIGDIHTRFQAFSVRDRLKVNGTDDPNLLLWTYPLMGDYVSQLLGNAGVGNAAVYSLDQWLTNLDHTDAGRSMPTRLAQAKPADATNRCYLARDQLQAGGWELYDQPGSCATRYPVHGDPRLAAGEPQADNVIKCAPRPIDPADYKVTLSAAQRQRLATIFPAGVCDYTKPGVGQQPPAGTWQNYGP
jgi:hypothetical protein